VGFLECCLNFEWVADFPILKATLVDQLIANEPGPKEILRGPDNGTKDDASGVEQPSSPIGSFGNS